MSRMIRLVLTAVLVAGGAALAAHCPAASHTSAQQHRPAQPVGDIEWP
jgi:hypothetical protein